MAILTNSGRHGLQPLACAAPVAQSGGFDPRVWTLGSLLDLAAPIAAGLVVFWCTRPG